MGVSFRVERDVPFWEQLGYTPAIFEECENTRLRRYGKWKSVRKTVGLKIGVNTEDAEARSTEGTEAVASGKSRGWM